MIPSGKHTKNYGKIHHAINGKNIQKTMERSTMLFMGKLTMSMAIFSIAM